LAGDEPVGQIGRNNAPGLWSATLAAVARRQAAIVAKRAGKK